MGVFGPTREEVARLGKTSDELYKLFLLQIIGVLR
jgi:hypothetical protein